jgi:hypothetical protein
MRSFTVLCFWGGLCENYLAFKHRPGLISSNYPQYFQWVSIWYLWSRCGRVNRHPYNNKTADYYRQSSKPHSTLLKTPLNLTYWKYWG